MAVVQRVNATGFIVLFVIFSLQLQSCLAAKIAVLTFLNGISHFFMQEPIGRELELRGHEVTYIMCSMEPKSSSVKVNHKLIYHVPQYPINHFVDNSVVVMIEKGYMTPSDAATAFTILSDACDALLMNKTLLSQLEGTDLLFADNSFGGCGQLLQIKVGIPHLVDFSGWAFNDPFTSPYGIPWPVSYVPSEMTFASSEMAFPKRALNTIFYLLMQVLVPIIRTGIGSLQKKHGIAPEKTLVELIGDADLLLMPANWALEWSRPVPPNVKVIGSTSQRPAGKLPQDLEDFMQSAEYGVILVSFGSMVTYIDKQRMVILAEAFSRLKYKVLWKFNQTFPDIKNLKTVTWMPQNDILGHPNLNLFITHGGANSFYEGCYQGVPLLMTPFYGDQFGYTQKAKAAGLGAGLNIRKGATFTAENIIDAVNELIENPRYKANAVRVSKLMQDVHRTPQQEGADWIEYVIRHNGTRHLRPSGLDLSSYQYFLVDVAAFLFAVAAIVVFIVVKCCSCLKKTCCKGKKHKNE